MSWFMFSHEIVCLSHLSNPHSQTSSSFYKIIIIDIIINYVLPVTVWGFPRSPVFFHRILCKTLRKTKRKKPI